MPKPTFFNLPEEKRIRVVDAAIDEFANNSFQTAGVNRIVDNAGIAKGSFYQYFNDKEDVFRYILEVTGERKLKYLTEMVANLEKYDFFDLMKELFAGGIRFAMENPKLAAIGNRFIKETDPLFKEKILGEMAPKSNLFLEQMMEKGIAKGELDPHLDVRFSAYLLTNISISISEYYQFHVGDDYQHFLPYVDKALAMLKHGMKNPQT